MAITRTALGTFQTKAAPGATTMTTFTGLTLAAGETLVIGFVSNGANPGATAAWAGNAMTKVAETAASGVLSNVTIFAYYSASGGTGNVVMTTGAAFWSVASAVASWASKFTELDPSPVDQSKSASTTSAQTISSGATPTLAAADELLVGLVGTIGPNGDIAGTWGSDITTAGQRLGSTGGSATSNATVSEGYTLSTASTAGKTASKSGMTTANRAHACVIATFKKFAGPQTLTPGATVASWVVGAALLLGSGSATPLTPAAATTAWAVPAPALAIRVAAPTAPVATWTVPATTITPSPVTLAPAAASAPWAVPASTVGGATGAGTLLASVTPVGTRHDFTGCVGLKFTPTANILITALGRWRVAGNTQSHTLRLMRESAGVLTDLATVVVDLSSGTVAAFKYAVLASPIPLTAGTTYHIFTSETNLGDDWNDDSPVTTASISAPVTSVFQTPCGSSGYTDNPSGPNRAYGQVDAQWTTVPTLLPAATVASWTAPASTLSASPVTFAPAATAATWTTPASVLTASPLTVAPAATTAAWAVPASTLSATGPVQTFTPAAVIASWAVPASTASGVSVTLAPAAALANWTVPAATLAGSGSSTLVRIAVPTATWAAPASAAAAAPLTFAPAATTAAWTVPASSVGGTPVSLTPAATIASWGIPASAAAGAGAAALTPAATTAGWTVPVPTLRGVSLTVAPVAVPASWTVPAATVTSGAIIVAPGAATAAWAVPASTLAVSAVTLAPAAVPVAWTVPASTLTATGSAALTPAAAPAAWVVSASTLTPGAVTFAPAAATAAWAVPASVVSAAPLVVAPVAVPAAWAVPDSTLSAGAVTVAPGAAAATWTTPAPTFVLRPQWIYGDLANLIDVAAAAPTLCCSTAVAATLDAVTATVVQQLTDVSVEE